jgi:membrane protease YdiL (CAAX protease family)
VDERPQIGSRGNGNDSSGENVNSPLILRAFFENGKLRSIWRFFLSIVVVAFANIIAGKTAFALFGNHPLVADATYRTLTLLLLLGGFSLLLRHVDGRESGLLAAQGLPVRRAALKDIGKGFGLGFLLITLSISAIALLGTLETTAALNTATVRRALIVVVLLLSGAMFEEVMFRGYPFQRLVEAIGPWFAILVLSVLFGVVHLQNPNAGGILSWGFFNTIAVGVLLALSYLKTKALWFPFGFHFAWNFALGVVFGLPVSGLSMFSVIVRSHTSGSKLLTGGNYGIEASLTGAVVIVLGILLVLALPAQKQAIAATGEAPGEVSHTY